MMDPQQAQRSPTGALVWAVWDVYTKSGTERIFILQLYVPKKFYNGLH
jgi:hypothetical protein